MLKHIAGCKIITFSHGRGERLFATLLTLVALCAERRFDLVILLIKGGLQVIIPIAMQESCWSAWMVIGFLYIKWSNVPCLGMFPWRTGRSPQVWSASTAVMLGSGDIELNPAITFGLIC